MVSGYGEGAYGETGYGIENIHAYPAASGSLSIDGVNSLRELSVFAPNSDSITVASTGIEPTIYSVQKPTSSITVEAVLGTQNLFQLPEVGNIPLSDSQTELHKLIFLDRSVIDFEYTANLNTLTNTTLFKGPKNIASLNDLNMKKGDTHPPIRAELFGLSEEQFYYSDINIIIKHKGNSEVVVNKPVDERDSVTDEVIYYWTQDGSDIPYTGTYQVEFKVVHPDGRAETFPSEEYLTFDVEASL